MVNGPGEGAVRGWQVGVEGAHFIFHIFGVIKWTKRATEDGKNNF